MLWVCSGESCADFVLRIFVGGLNNLDCGCLVLWVRACWLRCVLVAWVLFILFGCYFGIWVAGLISFYVYLVVVTLLMFCDL